MSESNAETDHWPFEDQLTEEKIAYQSKVFANHPLFKLLQFSPAEYDYGYTKFSLAWQEQLSNYGYELHGGMHATMIDTASGQAIFTALKRGYRLTTVHMDVRYFRPFTEGEMVVEGRVSKFGKTLCHTTATLTVGDRTIATGSTIYAIIDPSRRKRSGDKNS